MPVGPADAMLDTPQAPLAVFPAPRLARPKAVSREPSKLAVGPSGSWPLRFDKLVQPLLDAKCIKCHSPKSDNAKARKFNLTAASAYNSLCRYGTNKQNSLTYLVHRDYRGHSGLSTIGGCAAANSAVMAKLTAGGDKPMVKLTAEDRERLIVWMDTYAQRLGSFSDAEEKLLVDLRRRSAALLIERDQTVVSRDR